MELLNLPASLPPSMKATMEKIDFLKKITLSVEAGTDPDSMNLTPQSFPFEFIYGLGSAGLTPFELQLADKAVGDEIHLRINRGEIQEFFQHLILPPLNLPENVDSFYLRVMIREVAPADQREVIKAMAEIASCGDHCCGH